MRFTELVLSDPAGDEALRVALHPQLTVLSGLPGPARQELVETLVTAAAGGRDDRLLIAEGGPASAWLEQLAPGRAGADLVAELARLDARLADLDQHDARVAYHQAVARLEALDDELATVYQLEPSAENDRVALATADRIEGAQERLAATTDRAERCRRVASWVGALLAGSSDPADAPAETSSELTDLVERWDRARHAVARFERELAAHRADEMPDGGDRPIAQLAPLDQDRVWACHRRVRTAELRLAAARARRAELEEELPEDVEAAIDAAHLERVRAEEAVASRWGPGIVGSSVPAGAGLVVALVQAPLGALLVVLGVAIAARLVVGPRVALARAASAERRELARVGATSYLGLHLRRLNDHDDPDGPDEVRAVTHELEDAAGERTAALLEWRELVGRLDPAEADGLEPEVRAAAIRCNATLRTETDARLQGDLDAARRDLAARGDRLAATARDLTERADVLEQEAVVAADGLDTELRTAGIAPDDVPRSLAVLRADASRRERERASMRTREELERTREELAADVAEREREPWVGAPLPPPPPAGSNLLRRRRAEVVRQITASMADALDGARPDVPLVVDEPLAGLDGDELAQGLEAIRSHPGQVLYLTEDAAVADWARRADRSSVTHLAFD